MSESSASRGNLVVCFAGEESVHSTWLSGPEPKRFDLALVYYGNRPGRYAEDAEHYLAQKGLKYSLLQELAEQQWVDLLPQYDRIWIPDDDIAADTACVNRLFDASERHDLRIAQPAIAQGELSFEALRVDPRFELRYSRFVEVMCPLFRQDVFQEALPTFSDSVSAWGLDWVWSHQCGEREIAVIDEAPMDHTRPLGTGLLYQQLAEQGITPHEEQRGLRYRYGIRNYRHRKGLSDGSLRMRGILRNGQIGWNRRRFAGFFSGRIA